MNAIKRLISSMAIAISFFSLQSQAQYLPTNVAITTETSDQLSPSITVDPSYPNHLEATWDDARNSSYVVPGFSFSTDGGSTWSAGSEIPVLTKTGRYYGFNTSSGIDKSGNEYCTFTTSNWYGTGPLDVWISVSTNNGVSWPTYRVSPDTSGQDKPYMAIDNTSGQYSGRLYVAWVDASSGTNILISHSTNQGQTWTSPCVISSARNLRDWVLSPILSTRR